jgi:hypothetical protein
MTLDLVEMTCDAALVVALAIYWFCCRWMGKES